MTIYELVGELSTFDNSLPALFENKEDITSVKKKYLHYEYGGKFKLTDSDVCLSKCKNSCISAEVVVLK